MERVDCDDLEGIGSSNSESSNLSEDLLFEDFFL